MQKNLKTRTVIIVVTILLCVIGIIGLPTSKAELIDHLKNNIRLGLDLKGGSHLVMEVQVQDAVKGDAQQTVERLQQEGAKQGMVWNSAEVSDPQSVDDADKVTITIKGVNPAKSSDFRNLVSTEFPTYILTTLNSTDDSCCILYAFTPAKAAVFRNLVSTEFPTYILTTLNSTDYSMKLKPSDLIDRSEEHTSELQSLRHLVCR